ncbi:MAG: hypothetical protein KBD24_02230 [Candidatus Pacebacteria bacterium]|nr:hypothetical protein [Candidatus Paceibacterota bacterium]
MIKTACILTLCFLSSVAHGKNLQDLVDACKASGTEHVFLFTDPTLSNGVDISRNSTRDTVGWNDPLVLQTCSAEYIALAHCHFSEYRTAHLPSPMIDGGGGDIVSMVLHEKICAHARLVPGAERAPIEHLVVAVGSGEVTASSIGSYFRNLIKGRSPPLQFGNGRASSRRVFGRGPPFSYGYPPALRIPPHVQAVLAYEKLRDTYLEYVTKNGSAVSLAEMVKGHETHFTAREWRLW